MITNNKTRQVKEGWRVKLYLVEGPDCSISQGCFGRAAEELQHCRTRQIHPLLIIQANWNKTSSYSFNQKQKMWGVSTDQTQQGPAPWQCSLAYGQWQRQPHTPPSHFCSSGSSQWSQTRDCHDWEDTRQKSAVSRRLCASLKETAAALLTRPPSRPAVCLRSWWACNRRRETWDQTWWTCWASWWRQGGRSSWDDTTGPRHGTGGQDKVFNKLIHLDWDQFYEYSMYA